MYNEPTVPLYSYTTKHCGATMIFSKVTLLTVLTMFETIFLQINFSEQCDLNWIRLMYMISCGRKRDIFKKMEPPLFARLLLGLNYYSDLPPEVPSQLSTRKSGGKDLNFMWPGHPAAPFESHTQEEDIENSDGSGVVRRQIQGLLKKCCQIPPVYKCKPDDFIGAC